MAMMDDGMLEDVEMTDEEDVMVGLPHRHGGPPHFVQQHFVLPQQQQQPVLYHHYHYPFLHSNAYTQPQHQHQQFHHSSSRTLDELVEVVVPRWWYILWSC